MGNPTIEQELEKQEYVLLQTTGISMEPLLHNRKSSVVIKKALQRLKKYDVVLFRRNNGEYVLHRIVEVRDKDYLICGDNGIYKEPVRREQIIGIMAGFYPDESERYISCTDQVYRRYLRTLRIRYGIRWIKDWLRRKCRKMKR